jgi:hypothetical protein
VKADRPYFSGSYMLLACCHLCCQLSPYAITPKAFGVADVADFLDRSIYQSGVPCSAIRQNRAFPRRFGNGMIGMGMETPLFLIPLPNIPLPSPAFPSCILFWFLTGRGECNACVTRV